MRTIGVVTVARSDYGIYLPVLRRIREDPDLELRLIVGGMHLSPEFGSTVKMIEADGFEVAERVEMLMSSDTPEGIAMSMGLGTLGFAQAYARSRPDMLVVLGDRFEMHSAALAALPFNIPIAHIHGGELTEAAIDDALRHSITKLSHVHFVAATEYARRVIQLGEEPWRVVVTGAPGLDNLREMELMNPYQLEVEHGISMTPAPLLVTFHPVTLEYKETGWQVAELLEALEDSRLPVVFTLPNADTFGRVVISMVEDYVQSHPSASMVSNLGTRAYFSAMSLSAAMVGNSSSGIIEAASFGLPVVNIGNRQRGRIRGRNVIDVGNTRSEVMDGIRRALQPHFRKELEQMANPYGGGDASATIVRTLKQLDLDEKLIVKRFYDVSITCAEVSA